LIDLLALLREKGLPVVVGEGPRDAKLVILGEALGKDEVEKGRPFVGKAGQMLDHILHMAGIKREEVYVMNVIPTRPPENKLERLEEYGIPLVSYQEWAKEELRRIRPNCILALGALPLRTLTDLEGITEWRGSILDWEGIKVVPTFHPAYIIRLPDKTAKKEREGEQVSKYTWGSARFTSILDAKRAREESHSQLLDLPERTCRGTTDFGEARHFLEEARENVLVSFDVETRGNWIDCISFSFSPEKALSIPRSEKWADELIRPFLWEHSGLVAQNGAFDMMMLLANDLPVRRLAFDTMIAHHFLYAELPHNLAYLTSIYTKEPYYKWMIHSHDWEVRWKYNALDAACTLEIARVLQDELLTLGVAETFSQNVMPLFHTIFKMGLRGVPVDLERKARAQRVLAWLIARKEKETKQTLGVEINLRSPKQLATYLYDTLKLPKQFDRKTKKVTTDEEAIKKLSKIKGQENLTKILDVRNLEKRKSTYADAVVSSDGRLRTSYSITGTETGRLSSKEGYFGDGWNSQNAPTWFRKLIVPLPGYIFIEADLKFAEALLISWQAGDKETIAAVRSGADIYRWHGSRMLNKPQESIDKEERDMVKPVILGCGYGLGPNHMYEMMAYKEQITPDGRVIDVPTGISKARTKQLRDLFFTKCPAIGEYQANIRANLRKNRLLSTAFNRWRLFLGRLGDELFRKGYAQGPQSMCVDYMNRAMVRVDARLPDDAWLLLQIHDAMLVMARKELANEVIKIMVSELSVPVVINNEPLVIPTEIKTSEESWGAMKTIGIYNKMEAK
jgi:uracil-DNA glycosylase family 4